MSNAIFSVILLKSFMNVIGLSFLFLPLYGNQGILGATKQYLSGIYNNFSYSFGQFHYETDGFC